MTSFSGTLQSFFFSFLGLDKCSKKNKAQCPMNLCWNVASLVSHLIKSTKENGTAYNPKLDKFGHVSTTTSWQDGPWNHYRKKKKPDGAQTKKGTLLSIQVLKCQLRRLFVTKSQRDHHQSACFHLWVGLFTTRKSVCGACKVRTRGTQIECKASCSESTHSQHGAPSSTTQSL